MNDPELIELRNKFLLGIFIAVIFCTPLFIFMNKSFGNNDSDIYKFIKKKESFVVFVENKECGKCDSVKEMLDKRNVSYFIMNVDKTKDLDNILERLQITEDIQMPGLIYVDAGSLKAYIFDIETEEEVNDFVTLNKLENTK